MISPRLALLHRRFPLVFHGNSPFIAALLLFAAAPLLAQGTHLWTQSRPDEFEHGVPRGVEITSDGKLRVGPSTREILTTPSTYVWAIASDNFATTGAAIYLATGSPASVLRVGPKSTSGDPKSTTIFESKSLAIQAVRLGPDGLLYAATLPDGKVYRLRPNPEKPLDESTAEVVFDLAAPELASPDTPKPDPKSDTKPESKSHYIWDMTFDPSGRLYIATGGPGAVYRVDLKQSPTKAEVFLKTDEAHLRVLAWDRSGNLLAGSDGSGLVYRISPEGKGYVLYSAPRREITGLAVAPDGTIYAADVGDKTHNPLPPLPVQNGVGITITFTQPGSVQAANASTTLPEGSEIYALTPDTAPRKLWSGKDEIVYTLSATADGVLALTGNRGRILLIHADGSSADLAHVDAQQAVTLAQPAPGVYLIGTANTGKLYALTDPKALEAAGIRRYAAYPGEDDHSYLSDVLDAGSLARWGHIEVDPSSRNYQLFTRSGNVEQPVRSAKDWGWSDWQPATAGKIASPPGRYLQWKVTLASEGEVSGVGVNYLPINAAPVVDDVLVVPGARLSAQPVQANQPGSISIAFPSPAQPGATTFDANTANASAPLQATKDRTAVTVRWAAHDDNGDDLTFDLFLRGDGEHIWRLLRKAITDKSYSFDAVAVPDGGYQIKIVASDAPSHVPGEELTGDLISERFELDTTPPEISNLKAAQPVAACEPTPCSGAIPVAFDAQDTISPITHAEFSLDAGPWQYMEPVGGLSDSKHEHYAFQIPLPAGPDANPKGEHLVTVRVYDRHENVAAAKAVVPAQTPTGSK